MKKEEVRSFYKEEIVKVIVNRDDWRFAALVTGFVLTFFLVITSLDSRDGIYGNLLPQDDEFQDRVKSTFAPQCVEWGDNITEEDFYEVWNCYDELWERNCKEDARQLSFYNYKECNITEETWMELAKPCYEKYVTKVCTRYANSTEEAKKCSCANYKNLSLSNPSEADIREILHSKELRKEGALCHGFRSQEKGLPTQGITCNSCTLYNCTATWQEARG